MILIFTEEKDSATNGVINWLEYWENPFIRVNETSNMEIVNLSISEDSSIDINLRVNEKSFSLSTIKTYWYRRGGITFKDVLLNDSIEPELRHEINTHLKNEYKALNDLLLFFFEQKKCIGSFHTATANKIITLFFAKKVVILIPNTLITRNKNELEKFKKKNSSIITKGIQESIGALINDNTFFCGTLLVDKDDTGKIEQEFAPSLFQENIEKAFELRIFYLNKKCYSIAIFSQDDPQTKIDFRNYNPKHPNRIVPFILPITIEEKLIDLMDLLNLNTGSIDMIVTKDEKYVFLEVNPVGQFGMVSYPGNYYLEREIASVLSNKE